MKLQFPPFAELVNHSTTPSTRNRYLDSQILSLEVKPNRIKAVVRGSFDYTVLIEYNQLEVTSAECSCFYDHGGYCKHIVHTLAKADRVVAEKHNQQSAKQPKVVQRDLFGNPEVTVIPTAVKDGKLAIQDIDPLHISVSQIKALTPKRNFWNIQAETQIFPNKLTAFFKDKNSNKEIEAQIEYDQHQLMLSCSCGKQDSKPCPHLHTFLKALRAEPNLQLAFDHKKRLDLLKKDALKYGLKQISDAELDGLYTLYFFYNRLHLDLKTDFLILTDQNLKNLKTDILPQFKFPVDSQKNEFEEFIVFTDNEYDDFYQIYLFQAPLTKTGKIKSPITPVDIQQKINQSETKEELQFYANFVNQIDNYNFASDVFNHQSFLANPQQHACYFYPEENYWNQKITPKKLIPVNIVSTTPEVTIRVKQLNNLYTVSCTITLDQRKVAAQKVIAKGRYLYRKNADTVYFIENANCLNLIEFFAEHKNEFNVHHSQFEQFKTDFLDAVENIAEVKYDFIKAAPAKIIKEQGLNKIDQHLIYLSESENYITITPAVRYGELEVSVLSKRNLYTTSPSGQQYKVKRNWTIEDRFLRSIQQQHPDFKDRPEAEFFYLHKQEFLDEGWFLDAFEFWRAQGYEILGFKQLKNNTYSPHKISVSTNVKSGIDWFDIHTQVAFGPQKVTLKSLQKSVRNKTRYVALGDGSQGILPQEWLDKFSSYFRSGEIKGDTIRTHKSNFQLIDQLFEREVLSEETQLELDTYNRKLSRFKKIKSIQPPKKLKAELRNYQKEGLNWLNFLDEFGFGGCLADDMGLGKTIQLIAYILKQHEKGRQQPNLIVLPTSLLFNWQSELDKFAPHLKYYLHYGTNRSEDTLKSPDHDIILTSYGILLSDIELLKSIEFNLVVLDESQAIKNPNSKRYKAARLLQARQRIVATGTPIENNTFDLYAQLSFAIPGLLGSQKQFKDNYSTPIDQFQDDKRACELQRKVHPFILRRTKKQVAQELPEKTEMIIRCEMDADQRRIYNTYKAEFQNYLTGTSDDELSSSSLHILQGLTKMRQICNSPALLSDEAFYGKSSSKLNILLEQITELKDNHKILVFSQFVGMLDLIKSRLDKENIGYAYLTGQTRNRQEQVDDFQTNPDTRVFLISLKAGGTGLNLTEAEYVFIVDPWWNPAVENQAIDRAYRIGQENKVTAIRLITPDSIEEKILNLQEQKLQLVEELIHTDHNAFKKLNKTDLIDLV